MMENKGIIMFDGHCNLCNGFVQFVLKYESEPHFFFASLQSEASKKMLESINYNANADDLKSVLLVRNDVVFTKSTAAIEIFRRLNILGKFAVVLYIFPKFVRDYIYDWIAQNRYVWFGKSEECWMPDARWKGRFL